MHDALNEYAEELNERMTPVIEEAADNFNEFIRVFNEVRLEQEVKPDLTLDRLNGIHCLRLHAFLAILDNGQLATRIFNEEEYTISRVHTLHKTLDNLGVHVHVYGKDSKYYKYYMPILERMFPDQIGEFNLAIYITNDEVTDEEAIEYGQHVLEVIQFKHNVEVSYLIIRGKEGEDIFKKMEIEVKEKYKE